MSSHERWSTPGLVHDMCHAMNGATRLTTRSDASLRFDPKSRCDSI